MAHIDGGYRPCVKVNVLSVGLSLAGFRVIIYGRFWVITEDFHSVALDTKAKAEMNPTRVEQRRLVDREELREAIHRSAEQTTGRIIWDVRRHISIEIRQFGRSSD